jgi:L-ascorbate metabolism protein UlaG (beta-lactamase superfamily)
MLKSTWIIGLCVILLSGAASAQDRRASHCIAIADATPGIEYLHKASFNDPIDDPFAVRISYIDHSMFLIQTADGLDIVTDYTGFVGATRLVPDVVTMNNAHDSHWTPVPDPRIPNVLRGWRDADGPREHRLELGEVLIRNVTTDIRAAYGSGRIDDNNSIFVFEAAGLCIAHLGHLHHEPTDAQYAALGRIDVLMAAVDGGLTVDLPTMYRIVERLKSSVIIPMHWFSGGSLERFLAGVSGDFAIRREGVSSLEVSLRDLPDRPTVIVLEPRFLRDE